MASIDILLPTVHRPHALIATLAGVAAQELTDFRVIVADQNASSLGDDAVVRSLRRVIEARGGAVEWHHRPVLKGVTEQRDFLLGRATAEAVLFLDDDVFMEPWVLKRLERVLAAQACGFVGAFPTGLSFREDLRPAQQNIAFWDGPVLPEAVDPDTPAWDRWQLHRAANLWHVARHLPHGTHHLYKVAWVASCVLYDRAKLLAVGGFSFWPSLPRFHSGEDVLVQNLLMRRWGGCAIIPSGTYHAEVPSTVLNEQGTVDGHALALLPEMIARYAPPQGRASAAPTAPPAPQAHP